MGCLIGIINRDDFMGTSIVTFVLPTKKMLKLINIHSVLKTEANLVFI